ncbi:polymer-forming cytoskeletal protein [Dysgonomonas sp. 520]|uniref:bactofilin family protein n=1 Tax=Dysgonomonas sp. 520 TaxID=2302931 RepID=UPI0021078802|nr:polymer-forming cytoskeletal protein [Dysgonomonas sp. 520]
MGRKEITPPNPSSMHNVLSSGTVLTGNLVTGDDIRIDGTIEGNIISSGKIIVGNNGNVSGDIECHNLDLMGKVSGNIQCSEIVILRSSARLDGNIKTQIIEIEPGASFYGTCQMNDRRIDE